MSRLELAQINKEIYESGKRLENGSKQLFALAKEMAISEREYRKQLGLEIMALRDAKVQTTLIPDLARSKTSDLKFARDMAELKYKAALNSLDAIKQQISGLQTIIKYQSEM